MNNMQIRTSKKVIPMIYAYSTPEIPKHNGWVKIGYTEKQTVEQRQKQQSHTIDVEIKEEWKGNAIFEDGSGEYFKDIDFHRYLRKLNIENKPGTEWFHIDPASSKARFYEFKENRGILSETDSATIQYVLRDEQKSAVEETKKYFEQNPSGEFLWNAKPRFGKTLTVYDFCKQINAKNVLIVTNRPAIANSWYSDYEKFLGIESGYKFVSSTSSLKGKKYVLSRDEYINFMLANEKEEEFKCIEFVSLQDLKGSQYFGGEYDKLKEVADITWDVLVIDEAHEGVDTFKTDTAFDHIKRKFTLHLSGTPFKALANDKFSEKSIFNWTYADEQRAKANWKGPEKNPYQDIPKLNLFTYKMSDLIKDEIKQGIDIDGETEEYAFDLNEFFTVKDNHKEFVHDSAVDKFLDALTKLNKFPFSTEELRNELKHTFWLLNRVDSAKLLKEKLNNHPVFKDYEVVLAAGDGKIEESEETSNLKAFDKVRKAIESHDKTITLSVGQLTTGVTIPEWTAVLMLSSIKSPSLYMQAAFRAQNPFLFANGTSFLRKENAYVFDFDPARTLTIFEEFANDLSTKTSDGRGSNDERKENIKELLNFFPVIGEDENGEMAELDAEKVLSIPRKIHAQEVVKRGFMSNFLFQNISNIFHAPTEILDIIKTFTPVEEPKSILNADENTGKDLYLDENGEVNVPEEVIAEKTEDIFGDKIYKITENGDLATELVSQVEKKQKSAGKKEENKVNKEIEKIKKKFHIETTKQLINTAKKEYGSEFKPATEKRLVNTVTNEINRKVDKALNNYEIEHKRIEKEAEEKVEKVKKESPKENKEKIEAVQKEAEERKEATKQALMENLNKIQKESIEETADKIVKTIETEKRESEKTDIVNKVRDHLRGFSRTIPAFLMAYGNTNEITLKTFDTIIPDEVFKDVTSISLEQFRLLRDGGTYIDKETGNEEIFKGNLFDEVVFNDSVKEFLDLKDRLSNYFDEAQKEDIFDYIPPQKTNQIYTPKKVVKEMVDMLEQENPGCFDNPDKTFIDLYMKSGLYITEIVKRLFNSTKIKNIYPDEKERLNHIFKYQVYGLAPTEIIFKIATNFILGFDKNSKIIEKNNFKQCDTLEIVKAEQLEQELDRLFAK